MSGDNSLQMGHCPSATISSRLLILFSRLFWFASLAFAVLSIDCFKGSQPNLLRVSILATISESSFCSVRRMNLTDIQTRSISHKFAKVGATRNCDPRVTKFIEKSQFCESSLCRKTKLHLEPIQSFAANGVTPLLCKCPMKRIEKVVCHIWNLQKQ